MLQSWAGSGHRDWAQRSAAVLLAVDAKLEAARIAAKLGVHYSTVGRWLRIFDEQGLDALAASVPRGHDSLPHQEALRQLRENHPKHWSVYELCVMRGQGQSAAAEALGISLATVAQRLARARSILLAGGCLPRQKPQPPWWVEEAKALYDGGTSLPAIARRFQNGSNTVRYQLVHAGVEMRSRTEGLRLVDGERRVRAVETLARRWVDDFVKPFEPHDPFASEIRTSILRICSEQGEDLPRAAFDEIMRLPVGSISRYLGLKAEPAPRPSLHRIANVARLFAYPSTDPSRIEQEMARIFELIARSVGNSGLDSEGQRPARRLDWSAWRNTQEAGLLILRELSDLSEEDRTKKNLEWLSAAAHVEGAALYRYCREGVATEKVERSVANALQLTEAARRELARRTSRPIHQGPDTDKLSASARRGWRKRRMGRVVRQLEAVGVPVTVDLIQRGARVRRSVAVEYANQHAAEFRPGATARVFLKQVLNNGPQAAADIMRLAESRGIKEITLRRAMKSLSVRTTTRGRRSEQGGADAWYWELPGD